MIFNIQRFSTHDGNGIRTIIFYKGCPLRCLWCSNPESQSFEPSILYDKKYCKNFGDCILAEKKAISKTNNGIQINREIIENPENLRQNHEVITSLKKIKEMLIDIRDKR